MNYRSADEYKKISRIEDIKDIHGETIKDYQELEEILCSVFKFLSIKNHGLVTADLGSGTGVGACLLSKYNFIKEIFAITYFRMRNFYFRFLVVPRLLRYAHKAALK